MDPINISNIILFWPMKVDPLIYLLLQYNGVLLDQIKYNYQPYSPLPLITRNTSITPSHITYYFVTAAPSLILWSLNIIMLHPSQMLLIINQLTSLLLTAVDHME